MYWTSKLHIPFDVDDDAALSIKARMIAEFLEKVPDINPLNPMYNSDLIYKLNLRKQELVLDFQMLGELVFLDREIFDEYLNYLYDWGDTVVGPFTTNCEITYEEEEGKQDDS